MCTRHTKQMWATGCGMVVVPCAILYEICLGIPILYSFDSLFAAAGKRHAAANWGRGSLARCARAAMTIIDLESIVKIRFECVDQALCGAVL